MHGERWAMLIGVNQCGASVQTPHLRYAERDARAVYELLVDPDTGTFQPADIQLHLGRQAGAAEIKARLRHVALNSGPSDVLFVYFAGHAVMPGWSRQSDAYLATADLDLDALADDPERGLRMAFLRRDVFEVFAGTSFLVLDCCHAGAYVDAALREVDAMGTYGPQIDRHSALLSCPRDAASRESDDVRHGVLTHHLLRALVGEAAGPDGRVSFGQMAQFAVEQNISPMPGQLTQIWGPTTVLTQPSAPRHSRQEPLTRRVPTPARVAPCENPLDRCASSIGHLLERLFREARVPRQGGAPATSKVDRIRLAVEADSVAVVEFTGSGAVVVDATARFGRDELGPLLEQTAAHVFPVRRTSLGYVCTHEAGRRMLCVPVAYDDARALTLVLVDPALSMLEMGEPLAILLRAVWNLTVAEDPLQAEVQVLTALRAAAGRLPLELYEHCFGLYRRLVGSLTMVFQPVISLDRRAKGVGVHSYEALARRTHGDLRAPVDVLQAAHVWGDRFVIERDSVLLAAAIQSYAQADADGPWDMTKPISINVAVRSLLNESYLSAVHSVLDDAHLDPSAVTLEISEQDPIRPAPGEVWPLAPLAYFHRRLTQVARELGISFAVDDFGVGYSSLARMAELPLTQIKVDRAVLHHPLALDELELVTRVARHASDLGRAPAARVVIVEGFDDESPVTLRQLYERRIRFVQGYISQAPAATSLSVLGDAVRERIAALVRGDDDQRSTAAAAGDHRRARPAV